METNDYIMYNPEIKKRFMDFIDSREVILPNKYLEMLFKHLYKWEIELDKDCCNFTVNEILSFYKSLNRTSVESLTVMNSILAMYTTWCMQQSLVKDNQNHYSEIPKEKYAECVNKLYIEKTFVTKDQLYGWINELANPSDQFILIGLFEGLCGKEYSELSHLHYSDFNENNEVKLENRTVKVSNKLKNIAYESARETSYWSLSAEPHEFKLAETDDTIVKNYVSARPGADSFRMGKRIYTKFNRIMSYLGFDYLRPSNIVNSGKVNFIKENAEKIGITPKQYLYSDHIKELNKQFGDNTVRSIFYRKNEAYLQ